MQTSDAAQRELESLLEFYLASGLDCFLEEDAVDRFALSAELARVQAEARTSVPARPGAQPAPVQSGESAQQSRPPAAASPSREPIAANAPIAGGAFADAVVPDTEVIHAARDAARTAQTLDELKGCLQAFNGCNLRLTAKNLVFADGNPNARVMIIGEAPGRDEDLQGKPFVGRSGQLLDKMLGAVGLDRSSVYIANVVPWRPPGNRTPTPQETEICRPFIARQIELAAPDVLVFLGAASAKTLLDVQDGIRRMRGRWMTYDCGVRKIPSLATYHPAYLLRSPIEKRLSWRDFLSLRQKLSEDANS
ncbi:uracil-DNA glycosylase family protein [Labrenzia sp. CE80]|uniref:uracil-DNA glycosylase n=1 Tax=Labrenzia sp. CE80 TaxID=1788986 RepID=UPI002570BFEF|nr:uracil-DNA glycosylase family protein [Labrenzia sp. CE80]